MSSLGCSVIIGMQCHHHHLHPREGDVQEMRKQRMPSCCSLPLQRETRLDSSFPCSHLTANGFFLYTGALQAPGNSQTCYYTK